ncbi:MAG: hypothetical protein WD271_15640 [Acidimicrobiia bacterium]
MAQDLAQFVRTHLTHELEYMLVAATTWCACHPDTREAWPKHLVATAEYGAFVHQRALFELFCEHREKEGAYQSRARLGHLEPLASPLYTSWMKHLNAAVAHVWARWKAPAPVGGGEHLKNKVADFASEIVRLWRALEQGTPDAQVTHVLTQSREASIKKARAAAIKMGTPDLDWSLEDPFVAWADRKWWLALD